MSVYIAMLRGVNVGGKSLKMDALRAMFEALGFPGARTYVQSGNVVFKATGAAGPLAKRIADRIQKDFGLEVPVMLRTAQELAKVTRANPFLKEKGIDLTKLHVTFLTDPPTKAGIAKMEGLPAGPDRARVLGREVYLHCPKGYGISKLSNNALEKAFGIRATTRNWNSVNQLLVMGLE
jgi:uncharacterized protein (DUF1697 family)